MYWFTEMYSKQHNIRSNHVSLKTHISSPSCLSLLHGLQAQWMPQLQLKDAACSAPSMDVTSTLISRDIPRETIGGGIHMWHVLITRLACIPGLLDFLGDGNDK